MAHMFKSQGKKVLMAAGDTFRAGAIEQLETWGERVGVDVIKQQSGAILPRSCLMLCKQPKRVVLIFFYAIRRADCKIK